MGCGSRWYFTGAPGSGDLGILQWELRGSPEKEGRYRKKAKALTATLQAHGCQSPQDAPADSCKYESLVGGLYPRCGSVGPGLVS